MRDYGTVLRARVRRYMLRVLGVLVVVPGLGFALIAIVARSPLGDSAGLMGGLGAGLLVGTVGAAFAVHRKTVRCPACDRWLLPLGMNGYAPSVCPHCDADLR